MSQVMTIAEVAAYFRHEAPESEAAVAFVRRLVRQGLPALRGMRPMKFVRAQVEAFAAQLATDGRALETPATARKVRPKRRPPGGESPIRALLAQKRGRA